MPTQAANPYESPGVTAGGRAFSRGVITPLFVAAIICTGALFLGVFLTRGPLLQVYADFGSELPNPTIIAMSPWSLVAVGILLFVTIVKQLAVQYRSIVRAWNTIACILAVVLGFCYVVAAFMPFIVILQSLD